MDRLSNTERNTLKRFKTSNMKNKKVEFKKYRRRLQFKLANENKAADRLTQRDIDDANEYLKSQGFSKGGVADYIKELL
tara:strand:+ start:202 stop:438 length:237 start_codon:yes stop_codon:yes gene_type:complete